jgi:hypothetical protein
MFDNLTPNQMSNTGQASPNPGLTPTGANANPPAQPADMFAGVKDLPAKPVSFQPKNNLPPLSGLDGPAANPDNLKKYFVLVVIVLVFILLFAGAFISYKYFFASNAKVPVMEKTVVNEEKAVEQKTSAETAKEAEAPIENQSNIASPSENIGTTSAPVDSPVANLDTDQDGLTDTEEKALGTNSNMSDTDNDGLFDREEAMVYKTNPLNADTDGDGFLDGDEVKKGYNPLGPGKLYEVKP